MATQLFSLFVNDQLVWVDGFVNTNTAAADIRNDASNGLSYVPQSFVDNGENRLVPAAKTQVRVVRFNPTHIPAPVDWTPYSRVWRVWDSGETRLARQLATACGMMTAEEIAKFAW